MAPSEELKDQLDVLVAKMQDEGISLPDAKHIFEGIYALVAFDRCGDSKAKAAKLVKMDRSNFRRVLRKHGLE